jgi:hypothetical protein
MSCIGPSNRVLNRVIVMILRQLEHLASGIDTHGNLPTCSPMDDFVIVHSPVDMASPQPPVFGIEVTRAAVMARLTLNCHFKRSSVPQFNGKKKRQLKRIIRRLQEYGAFTLSGAETTDPTSRRSCLQGGVTIPGCYPELSSNEVNAILGNLRAS